MARNIMKRSNNAEGLISAIEHFEKQPNNRRNRRVLAGLRKKVDKILPPLPEELSEKAQSFGAAPASEKP